MNWIKLCAINLIMFWFVLPGYSQDSTTDLNSLLQDASYTLNRFDEEALGLDAEIDGWTVSDSSKKGFHEELAATLRNANLERPYLAALLGKSSIRSTDLFDVYSELEGIASELDGQASNSANWGSSSRAVELAQLGSKALRLAADLGVLLRARIALQESQLTACAQKPVPKTH